MQNNTAVQQIVERLREKAKNENKSINYGTDNTRIVSWQLAKSEAFEQAASIAAEFLEQEKKDKQLYFVTFLGTDKFGKIVRGVEIMAESSEKALQLVKDITKSEEVYSAILS